ncbi:MAG: response regulator [Anaerolineae bacterium]|nr:response regulator [Anaerolineae bacterium]
MKNERDTFTILMVDDDDEDCMLTQDALRESRLNNPIEFVRDGVELMAYLRQEGDYKHARRPGLILLDLNMPRKDGREALMEIKADPRLRSIPVVILTTSKSETDVLRSYDLGANSYITKPITFQALVDVMLVLGRYWFEIVELPDAEQ